MGMRSRLAALLGLSALATSYTIQREYEKRSANKTPLTPKQKRARRRNKMARASRKINRTCNK